MKLTKFKDISLAGDREITIQDLSEISVKSLRKKLKDKVGFYCALALPVFMIAVVIAGTLPPGEDVMPLTVFKYSQVALYLVAMAIFFFLIYKAYMNYKIIKMLKIKYSV